MGKVRDNPKDRRLGRTYFREWIKHRGTTQAKLAEAIGISTGHMSHIVKGKKPYSQELLEAAADYLQTDPASLLMRDPTQPEAIWSLWERASIGQREDIERLAEVIISKKAG